MTAAVALPVALPKQSTFVCALIEALMAATGCAIVTFCVVEHPLASVMVQV